MAATAHDQFQAQVLALAPLAYWTFQGLAPGALLDVTGNGHDLTGTGTYTVGNNCIGLDGFMYASFDGATAYFTPALPGGLHPAQFTLLGMVQPTNSNSYMFSDEGGSGPPDFSAIVTAPSFGSAFAVRAAGVVAQDTKQFGFYGGGFLLYQCAYDGHFLTVSVNGTVIASTEMPPFAPGVVVPRIGRSGAAVSGFMRGGISDMALIGSAIPAATMANLAATAGLPTAGFPPQTTDLLNSILTAVTIRAY